MNSPLSHDMLDRIARDDAHFAHAPDAFFTAWKRGVALAGPEWFGDGTRDGLHEAANKWDLRPNMLMVSDALGVLSSGERMFLSAMVSFYDAREGGVMLKRCGFEGLSDLGGLDLERRRIIADLLLNPMPGTASTACAPTRRKNGPNEPLLRTAVQRARTSPNDDLATYRRGRSRRRAGIALLPGPEPPARYGRSPPPAPATPPYATSSGDAEATMLPVHSARLSPGVEPHRTIQAPGLTPFFLIGDDERSRTWLRERKDSLRAQGAIGLVVNVASAKALASLRHLATGLVLSPVSGDDLALRLGIRHYPVQITATGIEP